MRVGERRGLSLKFARNIVALWSRDQVTKPDCQFFPGRLGGLRPVKRAKRCGRAQPRWADWSMVFFAHAAAQPKRPLTASPSWK